MCPQIYNLKTTSARFECTIEVACNNFDENAHKARGIHLSCDLLRSEWQRSLLCVGTGVYAELPGIAKRAKWIGHIHIISQLYNDYIYIYHCYDTDIGTNRGVL